MFLLFYNLFVMDPFPESLIITFLSNISSQKLLISYKLKYVDRSLYQHILKIHMSGYFLCMFFVNFKNMYEHALCCDPSTSCHMEIWLLVLGFSYWDLDHSLFFMLSWACLCTQQRRSTKSSLILYAARENNLLFPYQ